MAKKRRHMSPQEADDRQLTAQMKAEDTALKRLDPEKLFAPPIDQQYNPLVPAGAPKTTHRALLVCLLLISVIATSFLVAWQYDSGHRLRATQTTVTSGFQDISIEYKTYQSDRFYGTVAYPLTDNLLIDRDAQLVADNNFTACKAKVAPESAFRQCMVDLKIHGATTDFLQLEYTTVETTNSKVEIIEKTGLLYYQKTGKRVEINNLFKPDSKFLNELSKLSADIMKTRFAKSSKLEQILSGTTKPELGNFKNFLLPGNEQLIITFNISGATDPVQVNLPIAPLFDMLEPPVVQAFFPRQKAKIEAERRVAAEAERKAQEAEAARKRTRELVAPNRNNIDCATMKCIALTYDDGPGHDTAKLLDILKSRQAVATFFVLGSRVAAHAALLKQVINQHSEVANHTWNHPNLTRLDNAALDWQITQTNQAIFAATGTYPKLLRPPEGAFDSRVIGQAGLPLALWTIDTNDWRDRDADILYQRVVNGARSGTVVLMHDIHAPAIEAAQRIIDELQRQGYVLVTMSELFGINKDNLDQFIGHVLRSR